MVIIGTCHLDECNQKQYAARLCKAHYHEEMKKSNVLKVEEVDTNENS